MNYYPFHQGDYLRDTVHLDPMEDIAYRRLLDIYYLNEAPIPLETQQVSRRLRLGCELVAKVLEEFFYQTPEGWRNRRCDAVIADYAARCERARNNGKAGGRPKKTKRVNSGNQAATGQKANQIQTSLKTTTQTDSAAPTPCGVEILNFPQTTEQMPIPTQARQAEAKPAHVPAPRHDWRADLRAKAAEANAVELSPGAPPECRAAWQAWQDHRTAKACEASTKSQAVEWTRRAAEAAARQFTDACKAYGTAAVIARVNEAIAGNWQGMNLDSMKAASHRPPQGQPSSLYGPGLRRVKPGQPSGLL